VTTIFEDDGSQADGDKLAALIEYVEAQGWCPMPDPWNRLWEMLLARARECGAPLPGPPLILAAWREAPPLMKRVRLLDQLEWAAEYGLLDEVDRFLRGLPVHEWFQGEDMPVTRKAKVNEIESLLPAAIAAVTECAAGMLNEATQLQERMQALRLPEPMADEVPAQALALDAEAVGALGVLKELRSAAESGYLNAAEVLRVLTEIDSRMMGALSGLVELSGRLERAAEMEERLEPVFELVIEAAGRLLEGFKPAQAATRALRDAMPRLDRFGRVIPMRVAGDGSTVVLEVGAEGGSLTLIGRENEDGGWRFARITDDQTRALFGEEDVPVTAPDLTSLTWVDSWEAGLSLMDRYPWAQLHPVYVHPEFVERVRAAVEERLKDGSTSHARYAAEKWERLFQVMG
jgi:hypothetical protein